MKKLLAARGARAIFDLETSARRVFDRLRDRVAVARPRVEGPEDQGFERAVEKLLLRGCHSRILDSLGIAGPRRLDRKGVTGRAEGQRCVLPALPFAQARDVRDVMPRVPAVEMDEAIDRPHTVLGVIQLTSKIGVRQGAQQRRPARVQRLEQA